MQHRLHSGSRLQSLTDEGCSREMPHRHFKPNMAKHHLSLKHHHPIFVISLDLDRCLFAFSLLSCAYSLAPYRKRDRSTNFLLDKVYNGPYSSILYSRNKWRCFTFWICLYLLHKREIGTYSQRVRFYLYLKRVHALILDHLYVPDWIRFSWFCSIVILLFKLKCLHPIVFQNVIFCVVWFHINL